MAERFRWSGEPLTLEFLDGLAADVARDAPIDSARHNQVIRVFIVRHFLGDEWYRKHAHIDSHRNSFFLPVFDDRDFAPRYSVMLLLLAEMLFNLQDVPGFYTCLEHMSLNQMESGVAELSIGMVLRQQGIRFRYIDPKDEPDKTYDLEVYHPNGAVGRGEIKCKYECTDYTGTTLANAFKDARKQIGPGNDGVLFMKIPQNWTRSDHTDAKTMARMTLPPDLVAATKKELKASSRIKKVIFYVFHMVHSPIDGTGTTHATMELSNARNEVGSPWNDLLLNSPRIENWVSIPAMVARWKQQLGKG